VIPALLSLLSRSTEATERIGMSLAGCLRSGDILTLDGDLGAGKTALTRGIARGLGLTSHVSSPTFTIVMEHPAEKEGQLSLYHFDVYRLQDGDDFLDSGLDEYLYKDGVSVLEWGRLVADALPENILRISMHGSDETRRIDISFPDSRKEDLASLADSLTGDLK
jgi:tRNA threonylcarbamoyladenosine biosynthesis protein TsaE